MKGLLILLCAVSVALTACSSGAPSVAPEAPAPPQLPAQPPIPSQDPIEAQMTTVCSEVADPQVVVDAFPDAFEELSQVGDVFADRFENEPIDGQVQLSMNALKTLTYNDEYYASISGSDSCGLNLMKGSFKLLVPGVSDYGTVRSLTVQGHPAFISQDTRDAYTLDVLVKDRLVVRIDADPEVGEERTIALANTIDFASIERAIP